MRIVIVGGGIAAAYLANNIRKISPKTQVMIVSEESFSPYDRIHLCSLVDKSATINDISLPVDPLVTIVLNEKITSIDRKSKRIFSEHSVFSYDKLIIATGSTPQTLFNISQLKNASVFRNAEDCKKISEGMTGREVVLVGTGPVGLELMEALNKMQSVKHITLLVRGNSLYDKTLSPQAKQEIESCYLKDGKISISYEDEIVDKQIENGEITLLKTKKLTIKNPFLIFGIGIKPNIDFARDSLDCDKGLLTNNRMQTEDEDIYAVGEAAQIKELNFVAGNVKACTLQADVAISNILELDPKTFQLEVMIDMLKVDEYELIDIRSPLYSSDFEKILITSEKDHRIDEYFIKDDKLTRFIGINTNEDIGYLESIIQNDQTIDPSYLYQNRQTGKRGRLICSCEHVYDQDIVNTVVANGVGSFLEYGQFSQAGRVCGKCKKSVEALIMNSQHLIDTNLVRKSPEELAREEEIALVQKRIEKFNRLHPRNQLDSEQLSASLDAFDISAKEVNSWVSMVTATMHLHPEYEGVIKDGINNLNKVPIIWLELADCSGNSEAFIKSSHPGIEDLIFDYISLDYHELLMSASGDQSESVLENIIKTQKGAYVLIVEGAIPMAMEGKYLRIGPKGETGLALLQKCAKDAALILSVGSCAFDGGVVAAAPNPTGAVGVSEALGRNDIVNLPGCPANPVNIVGTLLSYLMFEELPALDQFNRPLWAYGERIHDNCERRGHFELGEFVKEWGDEGAKKGWCLFEMGCKGPYTHANCPTMKFNQGTSWPVQGGHGCMGCVEKGFFDKYANERKLKEEK
ncbi:MAG: hydrogenase small subunit [Sulfurovum sp.]|uniref:hydrogenase small subunit n=1 Tax=Sulfurovum sp. TaxID=1969726 RepID=UPI002867F00D|nr:hydrogenase small subunit [Sulfurovum sp.]MCO4845506.1 hydrogenase small subunit [Sulfurovum sp.]